MMTIPITPRQRQAAQARRQARQDRLAYLDGRVQVHEAAARRLLRVAETAATPSAQAWADRRAMAHLHAVARLNRAIQRVPFEGLR